MTPRQRNLAVFKKYERVVYFDDQICILKLQKQNQFYLYSFESQSMEKYFAKNLFSEN